MLKHASLLIWVALLNSCTTAEKSEVIQNNTAEKSASVAERLARQERVVFVDAATHRTVQIGLLFPKERQAVPVHVWDEKNPALNHSFWPSNAEEAILSQCREPLDGKCQELISGYARRLDWKRVTVRENDTLARISRRIWGSEGFWRKLRAVNLPAGDCGASGDRSADDGEVCVPVSRGWVLLIPPIKETITTEGKRSIP